MTKGALERIVRAWVPRLGLERWKVEIDFSKPCAEENMAEAHRSSLYETATLRLEAEWAKWSAEDAELTIVHELLHLLHRDVDQAFGDIEGQLQRDAWTMADRRYRHAMEGFIDRTASRLVEIAGGS